jgi:hypothetical protein
MTADDATGVFEVVSSRDDFLRRIKTTLRDEVDVPTDETLCASSSILDGSGEADIDGGLMDIGDGLRFSSGRAGDGVLVPPPAET